MTNHYLVRLEYDVEIENPSPIDAALEAAKLILAAAAGHTLDELTYTVLEHDGDPDTGEGATEHVVDLSTIYDDDDDDDALIEANRLTVMVNAKRRLAKTLLEHATGLPWEDEQAEELHDNYLADADILFATMPHLFSLYELGQAELIEYTLKPRTIESLKEH